ncbi:alpha/beta hydrolase [Mycetocola sp. 2940]|uniref:alpha/beta fold hydrolase n=1 Tax=Mycetocola sp. 2940 TaxID=3156452 RepID=UPI0033925AC8
MISRGWLDTYGRLAPISLRTAPVISIQKLQLVKVGCHVRVYSHYQFKCSENFMKIHPDAVRGSVGVGGAEVTYYDTGRPGAGSPVVLVHGTGGSAMAHFRTVFPMLAARHRVIGLDLGRAETFEGLVSQVEEVIAVRTFAEPVALVGYSLGAAIATAVAARRAVTIDKLVLICGWAKTDSVQRARYGLWHRLYAEDHDALKIFSTLMSFGQTYLDARTPTDLRALIDARTFSPGIVEQMRINENVDVSGELEYVVSPTLIIGGASDQMVPIKHSRLLFGAIENSRFAEIPTGHAATTERPAQVFKLIDDFVRELPHTTPAGAVLDTAAF